MTSKKTVKVFAINTIVEAGPTDDPIIGIVSAITYRGCKVTYEIVWWDGSARKVEWLGEFEVRSSSKKDFNIGFNTVKSE